MIKAGDTITIMHDFITEGEEPIHERGDKVKVLGVETDNGEITGILLVGFKGVYFPTSFYEYFIGEKVAKEGRKKGKSFFNRKKFMSRSLVNTIKGVIDHPELGIPAYTFEEDDSYVECRRCKVLNKEELQELTN